MAVSTEQSPVVRDGASFVPNRIDTRRQILTKLEKAGYHELKSVSCRFHEGVAILEGRVSSFYLKQVAQTLLRDVNGVQEIVNRLAVIYPKDSYP